MNRREMLKAALVAPLAVLIPTGKKKEQLAKPKESTLGVEGYLMTYGAESGREPKGYKWVQVSGWADVGVVQGDIVGVVDNKLVKGV